MLRLDELAAGQDDRALDDVAHLADVARPVVLLEDARRGRIERGDRLVVAVVELGEERLHQQRQVVLAQAERRQLDGEHVQPVVQVLAQLAVLDGVGRVHVGRRNHADVHRLLVAPAEAAERPLLQDAQQLHLRRRRHLRDLVEEERPAIRELEAALAAVGRAGERALLVAEDLALEQRLGNRGAVDRHERHLRARAQLVDGLRDQLLAGARLAPDEHRCLRRRGLLDRLVDLPHLRAVADHLAERAVLAKLLPQDLHLAQRVLALDDLVEEDLQALRLDRLGQEDDDRQRVAFVLEHAQQLEAAHARHDEVADDDRRSERGDTLKRFLAVRRGIGREPPGAHEFGQAKAGRRLVLDDENALTRSGRSHISSILACRFYTVQQSSRIRISPNV